MRDRWPVVQSRNFNDCFCVCVCGSTLARWETAKQPWSTRFGSPLQRSGYPLQQQILYPFHCSNVGVYSNISLRRLSVAFFACIAQHSNVICSRASPMPHDPTYDVSAPPTPQRRSARPSFTSHLSPLESLAGALTAIDFLVYAPIDLQRQFAATKGPCGGAATLLIPVVILSIFGVIFTTNAAISDVSESSIVDLTQRAPMMLQVTCTSKSSQGSINPLCSGMQPEHHYTPAAFQFVPSISDSRCQRSIPRAMNRTTTQPWIDPHSQEHSTFSSPAIKQLEVDLGVPASDIAGKSDPFQLITFANLAQDLAIKPQVGCHCRPPGCDYKALVLSAIEYMGEGRTVVRD